MDRFLHSLTKVVNALNAAEIPFAVAGGCAVYARGGPATSHDVDLFIKAEDAKPAVSALVKAGMRAAPPPEDWLAKVYDNGVLIDLIFRPNFRAVSDSVFERASWMRVGPTSCFVISATDLMIDKLMVLNAHQLDFATLLQIARSLREQVDWAEVREVTKSSPYARAFLGLLDDFGISGSNGAVVHSKNEELSEYVEAHLRRAFAEDDRVGELGVSVAVSGSHVELTGTVATEERREALEKVVRDHIPAAEIDNRVQLTETPEPDDIDIEELS